MHPSLRPFVLRQHGVVARRQLVAAGCTPGQVDELVRRRRLRVVDRGVYRVPGTPDSPLTEPMVAVLRWGPGTRVTGERLLAAQGVALEPVRTGEELPFSVLVPAGRTVPRHDRWPVRGDRHATVGRPTDWDHVPTWSPARNVLEAVACAGDARRVAELVAAVVHHPSLLSEVVELLQRAPRHPAVPRLLASGVLGAWRPAGPGVVGFARSAARRWGAAGGSPTLDSPQPPTPKVPP